MGWESSGVVRFEVKVKGQGQRRIAKQVLITRLILYRFVM